MASLNYDGKKINFAVENIIKVSNEFETLSDAIKRSTTKIVSAKGFNEYIGGITGDTFKGYTTDCKSLIDQLVQNVREMQIKVLAFSQDKNEINAFLDTLDRLDYKNLDLSAIDDYISFGRKAKLFASGILADVGAAGLGVVEGVGEFLETGADLLDMGATAIFSVFTLGYDVITGENTTEKMWEETKARVSEKKVESAFNRFYNETELGQAIKNNAYGFETVRSIGKGIGYSAGIIALNVFTGGLASGAGILSAGSVGVGQLAATAGAMAISSGSEEAWADGATLGEGLVYGLANGAWESAQWAIGAKIGQIGGWGDKIATNVLKSAGKGSLTRIGLDTVDSGLEGFVQPALTMIYKDYEGETFAEKYNKAFETSGGWKNVLTQASLGGLMSSAGERMDARKLLKSKETDAKIESKSKTKTDVEIEKLSTDVESSSKLATQAAAGKKVETNTKTASDPNYKPEKTTKTETKTATPAASGQKIETNTKAASDPSYNSGKPAQTETKATTPAASGQKIETNTKTASDSSYKPEKTTKTETKTTTPATSGQKVETNTKTASNSSYNSGKPAQTETKTATQTTAGKNTNTNPQKVDTPNYNTSEYRLQKDQIVQDSIGNKTKTVSVSSDMKSETNITGNSKSVKNNVEISTTGQNPAMANVVTATTAATPVISTVELYKNGKVSADYGNYKLNNLVEDTKVVTPAVDAKLADINTKTANDLNYKKNAPAQEDVSVKAAPDKKVQMIEKTPSEPSGNYRDYGITENDTIGDMAKKLDKAVEEGKLTRAQADEMFEKAGEELKVVQKEKIESLKAENESLMADRKANIEEKELLIKEDGAKRENVRGHDEAVRQIDEMIAQNKEQIAAYEKEIKSQKIEESKRVSSEEIKSISNEKVKDLSAQNERFKVQEDTKNASVEKTRINAEEDARVKVEEEARVKAEEEARVKAEEEARVKAEEETRIKAEEEARIKAEEEARIKAEEEARVKAENVFSHENNIDGEIHRKVGSQETEKLSKSFKEDIVSDYNYEKRYSLTPQELEIANKVCAKINAGEAVRLNGNNARFSSDALRYIRDNADPSKCNVIIDSAFRGMDGQYKSKYAKTRYAVRTNFNLSEAISIMSKLEELRARVDMSLPRVERAKQIYEMVAKEFSYCHDYGGHHSVVASLKGITSNNILGKPGIVCAGYAQVYKNLCDMCNVPCDYIRGKSRGETHAWNVVFDDNGNAIPVDCTWKSGNPGADYFGRSKKFATDHVADADEVYRDYMPNASEINASVVDSKETIDKAISTMNYKFGQGEGLKRIKRFYETGDINQITRTDGCRTEIASMTREDILTYLVQNDIQSSHRMLDKIGDYMTSKYGARYNKIATLKAYLSGNSQVITRDHNYRTIMDSMPKEFILDYLRKL